MLPWLIMPPPVIWLRSQVLDLFQLGEESVKSVGVTVEREKMYCFYAKHRFGQRERCRIRRIGFVGLIAPHLARRLVGLRHRHIIPISGIAGMAIVVIGDFIGRTIFAPAELVAGIVVSVIGVPYFIYLLIRMRK